MCMKKRRLFILSYYSQESYEARRNDAVKGREVGEKSHEFIYIAKIRISIK